MELGDLNQLQIPTSLQSHQPQPLQYTGSSHQSSSTAVSTSLRSPLTFNHLSSEATEFMRLTPVNIKNLTSPIRDVEKKSGFLTGDENPAYAAYKDNFNLISRKLEKLLDELTVIYREIGYSNTEICDKEKLIFNHISDSITGFFEHANQERDKISADNQVAQQVLQRILQVIQDPKGTVSIPDLYTRNVIVNSTEQNPHSPKKPSSLLTRRKIITRAKSYVLKTYEPKLNAFLDSAIKFQTLKSVTEDYEPSELDNRGVGQLMSVVPPLDTCKYFKKCLTNAFKDVDKTCEFIIENRKALLGTVNFNDVSDSMIDRLDSVIKMFEEELESRMKRLYSIGKGIISLLKVLSLNAETSLDAQTIKILKQLSVENSSEHLSSTQSVAFSSSTLEKLDQAHGELKTIEEARKQEKSKHVHSCTQLWDKLKIPKSYTTKFEESNKDLSMTSLQNYTDELSRLQAMKKKLIKNLIQDSWTKIKELWAAMHFANRDTAAFQEMFNTMTERSMTLEDDEKVLETCELEISDLEKKYALYKPLLKLINEFHSLQNDKLNLEKSSKDSSRLLLRNSHRILLEEEKTRKRITRHFPNVIQELIQKLTKFEEDAQRPFVVGGARLLDIVLQQEEEIISKYPRSRINSNFKTGSVAAASTRKKILPATRSPKKDKNSLRIQPKSHRKTIQRSPMRRPNNGGVPLSVDAERSDLKLSYNRYMRATRMSSPIREAVQYDPTTAFMRSSPSKIPTLTRSSTFPKDSMPFGSRLNSKVRIERPEGLTQISPNKLNSMALKGPRVVTENEPESASKFKVLSSTTTANNRDKENIFTPHSLKSPIRLVEKAFSNMSSPQKGAEESVYRITRSPEGKFLLNVEPHTAEGGNAEGEDTSIMADDENFVSWKRERLARMNSVEGNDDLPSSVNWDTDVF
ncbi:LADA_0A01728g1_1 [Lachancea dasiensis]|uniref:LADA_0A01728g1_1 n=1 Tax=Lachancea dasiensis TaxID=1072105 RepID=A0A1G4IM87_9SACH|nr:LADA_0A01728g1_1 [Lachancea dasiensis]